MKYQKSETQCLLIILVSKITNKSKSEKLLLVKKGTTKLPNKEMIMRMNTKPKSNLNLDIILSDNVTDKLKMMYKLNHNETQK